MFCFHDYRYSGGLEAAHERLGDLGSKVFLDLEAARENIDNARHLGKADHLAVRKVGDVRSPNEGKKMMLTQRIELDIFDQNDLARI